MKGKLKVFHLYDLSLLHSCPLLNSSFLLVQSILHTSGHRHQHRAGQYIVATSPLAEPLTPVVYSRLSMCYQHEYVSSALVEACHMA